MGVIGEILGKWGELRFKERKGEKDMMVFKGIALYGSSCPVRPRPFVIV